MKTADGTIDGVGTQVQSDTLTDYDSAGNATATEITVLIATYDRETPKACTQVGSLKIAMYFSSVG